FSQDVARVSPGTNYLSMTVSPPEAFAGHVSDHLLAQLGTWPAAHGALVQVLRSVNGRGVPGKTPEGRAVLVHPGSGARRKCWPTDRFVRFIERLRGDGRDVRVIVGEVERETWPAAELDRLAAAARVVRPGSYVELLDELTKSG